MITRVVVSTCDHYDQILVEGDDPKEVAEAYLKIEKILREVKEEKE